MAFNPGPFPEDRRCSPLLHTQTPLDMGGHECVSHFSTVNCHLAQFLWWSFSVMLPSVVPKFPTDPACERVSYCLETSPSWLPPQDGPPSWNPLSPFLSLSFALPHSEEIGLPFWDPLPAFRSCPVGVAAHAMIFWCICGGKSGLPDLFLCHLGTALPVIISKTNKQTKNLIFFLIGNISGWHQTLFINSPKSL